MDRETTPVDGGLGPPTTRRGALRWLLDSAFLVGTSLVGAGALFRGRAAADPALQMKMPTPGKGFVKENVTTTPLGHCLYKECIWYGCYGCGSCGSGKRTCLRWCHYCDPCVGKCSTAWFLETVCVAC